MELERKNDKASDLFACMVDMVEESKVEQYERQNWDWWYRMHATPVLRDVDPIHQVRRIVWNDWNHTYYIDEETSIPRVIKELNW